MLYLEHNIKKINSKPKTLLVEYAPRGQESKTKKIRTYFTDLIQGHTDIEYLDLATETPDLFDKDTLQAYCKRNYQHLILSATESKLLEKIDQMRDQLLRNDILILSSPMYNFGYPAVVKAWIDSVMQKNFAYCLDQYGHVPKLGNLRVCIIYTAGIIYDQINENESWNGLISEGARLFEYMGAKVRVVHVEGLDMLPQDHIDLNFRDFAQKKFNDIASSWYGVNL